MATQIIYYEKEVNSAEKEVAELKKSLADLEDCIRSKALIPTDDPQISKCATENIKLKHRLAILDQALKSYATMTPQEQIQNLQSIQSNLTELFKDAIISAYPEVKDPAVIIALSGNNPKFGDYQCNSAMPLSNMFKQMGIKIGPREIGEKIMKKVRPNELIQKLELAGPGFINIFLSKEYVGNEISKILKYGVQPPRLDKKLRVLVDFSSPNIAKEMHVGHLRSTILGDTIARLLEYLGHDVLRINHLGDWGTQFGMLIAHLKEKYPDFLTKSPPISDLQAFYKESKKRFDEDEEFKKEAYSCVVKLQSFDPDYKKAWELICNVSRKEFQKIYECLDIKLIDRGESFYQSRMESLVKELEGKGFLEEDEGRKVLWGDRNQIPMTIVKSDGGFTYDTSDLAAIKQRIEEEKVDWIIYVTDAGQATHMQVLYKCAEAVGILDRSKVRVDHVGFGVVLGEDKKKFKTRSGDTVRLVDLLNEGLRRAGETLKKKGRDDVLTEGELKTAQEAVAYGCIKYADLSHNYNHEYVFSFDRMLEDKGNTAVYLLYAYTRIKSIARNINFTPEKIQELANQCAVTLEHDKELKLGKTLARFPDILFKITKDLCLHHLCEYLYEISTSFSEFYDCCYCIEKDTAKGTVKVNHGRILLAEATALVMEKCFDILGLRPVSKM